MMGEPRPRNGCLGATVRVIASAVLGGLAGIILSLPINAGAFERWHRWDVPPPQNTVELLLEAQGGLCARTSDSEIYAYNADKTSWDRTECVLAEPGRVRTATIHEYANPCRAEWPAFWFLANAPRNVVHCIDYSQIYRESNWMTYYALDADGQVWSWSRRLYPHEFVRRVQALTLGGGVVGLGVGLLWARSWRRRDQPPDPTELD